MCPGMAIIKLSCLPLDSHADAISSIFEQIIRVFVSQVATIVVLNLCEDVTAEQFTLGRASDLHLFFIHMYRGLVGIHQIVQGINQGRVNEGNEGKMARKDFEYPLESFSRKINVSQGQISSPLKRHWGPSSIRSLE